MDASDLFREAQRLLMEGRNPESAETFTKALEAGSEPAITHLSRGVAYMRLREHVKAVEDFSRVIEGQKGNFRVYYYRGTALAMVGEHEKAVEDLTKSLDLKPDNGPAYFIRGSSRAQLGRDDEAAEDMKKALSHSELAAQSFADGMGLVKTRFDKALAILSGERRPPTIELTEEEREKLMKWLQED
jgi:tetratricopeptide (TPR) repeat protein